MTDLLPDFVLPVDKPEGPTSHWVVDAARRAFGVKRIGHTGTLDPFASGLLLLCVGRATRLAEYFSALDKTYEAVAHLGVQTDTLDREGAVVAESGGWSELTPGDIEDVLTRFRGEIEQVPPQYSAKKVDGKRAYVSAREGREVTLDPCTVHVHALELTSVHLPSIEMRISCSSGTYVRSLARDIGAALDVGAHLTGLRRTRIGDWTVTDAVPVEGLNDSSRVRRSSVGPLEALRHLPTVQVDADMASRLVMGQPVPLSEGPDAGPVVVAHAGSLLAIGEVGEGLLRPRKVFAA